jgi:DNA-binding CsgD family transcriptional regulator
MLSGPEVDHYSPAQNHQSTLHAALHAALDDVLKKHTIHSGRLADGADVLDDIGDLCRQLLKMVPSSGDVLSTLSPQHVGSRIFTASHERAHVALPRDIAIRALCATEPAANRTVRFIEEAAAVGVEVRALPGLPTWLIVIGDSAVLLPRDPNDPGLGAVVVRTPGVVGIVAWAFEQAWRRATPAPDRFTLSARERRVLNCLSVGLKDELAARRLQLSVRTYRRHVTKLCERLDASSRFEAGAIAARRGLI